MFMGKLGAMCLLEEDFNWFLRFFAKCLVANMQHHAMIPEKQIAT